MIKLGECELDYPTMTRFKVWVGKRNKHKPSVRADKACTSVRADKACTSVRADGINEWVYMGEYGKAEMVRKFGEKWLDRGHEEGVRGVVVWVI